MLLDAIRQRRVQRPDRCAFRDSANQLPDFLFLVAPDAVLQCFAGPPGSQHLNECLELLVSSEIPGAPVASRDRIGVCASAEADVRLLQFAVDLMYVELLVPEDFFDRCHLCFAFAGHNLHI